MTATTSTILLGDLLVKGGLVHAALMADAVPISLKTGLPIGRVLVGSGSLSEADLQQALLAQSLLRDQLLTMELAVKALKQVAREHVSLEPALKNLGWQSEAFETANRLGQLLLGAELVSKRQLEQGLSVFYAAGLPLARVLVLKGVLSNFVAYSALSYQTLVRQGKLTRKQAIEALKTAANTRATIDDKDNA